MDILDLLSSPAYVATDRRTALQQRQSERIYLAALGLSTDIPNVLHITGTKGKGSTCAMIEAILRHSGYQTALFTSPHLHHPRERIRLNGIPLDPISFLEAVQWCHDRLKVLKGVPSPGYFRFLTYVALHVFGQSAVDVVIMEVGIGGRYDPTNCIQSPVACGFSSIGMDHQELLGETLRAIAWDKGGIMKSGAAAWTVPQKPEAMISLKQCALDVNISLNIAQSSQYSNWDEAGTQLLMGYQLENAALAVSIAATFERHHQSIHPPPLTPNQGTPVSTQSAAMERLALLEQGQLPKTYVDGLSSFEWKGRAQIIHHPHFHPDLKISQVSSQLRFYLDGAHTLESIDASCDWISENWKERHGLNFVLFNCHRLKHPSVLLHRLHDRLAVHQRQPYWMFFAPLISERPSLLPMSTSMGHLEWQMQQLRIWKDITQSHARSNSIPISSVQLPPLKDYVIKDDVTKCVSGHGSLGIQGHVFRSLSHGMKWFVNVANMHRAMPVRVFVTGSLYFVADVLKLIDRSSPQ